jgi:hypothetical protein
MHNVPILGGNWGLANTRNRDLADYLFKVITNHKIAGYFNPKRINRKGQDQFFLEQFFYKHAWKNSTTHDAFSCKSFNGDPWPTKRPWEFCFVGCSYCCDQPFFVNKIPHPDICPEECRPKDHQDWIHC